MNRFFLMSAMAMAIALSACKGANEKRGDEHLSEGRFRNAINMYLEAKKKGKVSDEFYDNFTLALVRAAEVEAKKDPFSSLLPGYLDKAAQNVSSVKNVEVLKEYARIMANVGKVQVSQEGTDYGTVLNAFAFIDSAQSVSKAAGSEAEIKAIRLEAEKGYVAQTLQMAKDEEDPVVSEYRLLQIAEVAPENADVKAALNKSRVGTRGYFLIFGENIGERASPRIDKYGYVMAFPTISLSSGSLKGELQIWASTGNNTEFDVFKLKLVSTDGREATVKSSNGGWCDAEVVVGKKGDERVEKKRQNFKDKGKLLNEFQCGINVVFAYDSNFVPDYVEYKDEYGIGRKYLGQ